MFETVQLILKGGSQINWCLPLFPPSSSWPGPFALFLASAQLDRSVHP